MQIKCNWIWSEIGRIGSEIGSEIDQNAICNFFNLQVILNKEQLYDH